MEVGNLLAVYTDSFIYTAPGVLDSKGNIVPIPQIHPCYHFHGFAGDQIAGDSVFFDKTTGNHAVPGANLSNANLWAAPGYVSTLDPATGAVDSVLRIPTINFDYSAGEKLILWMLGKWTPEIASVGMVGDGSSAAQRGWQIRVTADGRLQPILYGATTGFGGMSVGIPFDGTLKDFGVVFDGAAKKYCMWVNGELDMSAGYSTFNLGIDIDTKTTNTVNIGSVTAAPGGTAGIATATRACVILRLPAFYPVPSAGNITAAFKQLRANPGKLILASAF